MSAATNKRALEVSAAPANTPPFLVKRVKGEDSDSVDSTESVEDEKREKIAKAIRTILEVCG